MAESENCHTGTRNRALMISATAAASSVGSMKVDPRASWALIAATDAAGAWPHMAPVSPRHRST